MQEGSLFSTPFPAFIVCIFFLMMAILTCEMIPHSSFDLPSPVKVKLLSHVRLFATLWTVACKTPPSMGFSRQEYWSGFPFPSPGDLLNPGIQLGSPALPTDSLPSGPPRNPRVDQCGRTNCKLESGLWGQGSREVVVFDDLLNKQTTTQNPDDYDHRVLMWNRISYKIVRFDNSSDDYVAGKHISDREAFLFIKQGHLGTVRE